MDPLGGMRSQISQVKKAEKSIKTKIKRGKAFQKRAASFDKSLIIHYLIFFGIGILLGTTVFLPFYGNDTSLVQIMYVVSAALFLGLGFLHEYRGEKKIEWYVSGILWPGIISLGGAMICVYLGSVILWYVHSAIDWLPHGLPPAYQHVMMSSVIFMLVPATMRAAYYSAFDIEPRKYKLWMCPERPLDYDPGWNPDRFVFANLKFSKSLGDHGVTTVKARLPLEANLGQLIHLFLDDYNENRSPDNPVRDMRGPNDSIGWIMYTKGFLGKRNVFDHDLSVGENKIKEDQNVFLKRVEETEA